VKHINDLVIRQPYPCALWLCQGFNHIVNKQAQWVNRVKAKATDLKLSNQCFVCHSLFPLITFCTTSLVVKRCSLAHWYLLYTSLFGRALVSSTLTHLAHTGHFT
jgi:hypothetical protein